MLPLLQLLLQVNDPAASANKAHVHLLDLGGSAPAEPPKRVAVVGWTYRLTHSIGELVPANLSRAIHLVGGWMAGWVLARSKVADFRPDHSLVSVEKSSRPMMRSIEPTHKSEYLTAAAAGASSLMSLASSLRLCFGAAISPATVNRKRLAR